MATSLSFLHLAATNRGGAGMAASQMHRALTQAGHRSQLVVDHGEPGDRVEVLAGRRAALSRFASKARFKLTTHERYYFRDQRRDRPDMSALADRWAATEPDVIVCHALTDFVSFGTVATLAHARRTPVFWSLMDMAGLTGGCHYAWECERYRQGCGTCPALRWNGERDWSARTIGEKRRALAGMRSTVIAPSSWLADQARGSALFAGAAVEIVPLSVSPERYRPRDRARLRADFGLSSARPVLFFGARDNGDIRKGMAVLADTLAMLAAQLPAAALPTLLIAGDGGSFEPLAGLGFPIRQLGLIGPGRLADAYAVADLFVSPSLEDSGPMMINEAVMSGTPVVAFAIGVAPDLVESGVTGQLAAQRRPEALATALAEVLGWTAERAARGRLRAREVGIGRCSPLAQAGTLAALGARAIAAEAAS